MKTEAKTIITPAQFNSSELSFKTNEKQPVAPSSAVAAQTPDRFAKSTDSASNVLTIKAPALGSFAKTLPMLQVHLANENQKLSAQATEPAKQLLMSTGQVANAFSEATGFVQRRNGKAPVIETIEKITKSDSETNVLCVARVFNVFKNAFVEDEASALIELKLTGDQKAEFDALIHTPE
jgi:hypothetical protein